MAVKVGDTVRYLNSVGGGRVVRIADGIAYVDEDGFETPVLVRECVVVGQGMASAAVPDKAKDIPSKTPSKAAKAESSAPTQLPVVETRTGNVLNIVLGFEPSDIKSLSRSTFDAYVVNDSNYYIYISIASRADDENGWTPRFDGLIEPNIQEFAFELEAADLSRFDRLSVQYVAFKRTEGFEAKAPGAIDLKIDTTKFAKLHCFRPNPYFDGPVIAYDITVADSVPTPDFVIDGAELQRSMRSKEAAPKSRPQIASQAKRNDGPEVVDLHASELLDTTAGLSPADILNLQIERFCQVMDAHLKHPGDRIVFIHGKGEGVLRQAIMKELTHRYKGHDVQDASFREYGYGATQVTIRSQQKADDTRRDKRNRRR